MSLGICTHGIQSTQEIHLITPIEIDIKESDNVDMEIQTVSPDIQIEL